MCARREVRGALLADNPNTLRELVNLVKKKQRKETKKKRGGGGSQELSPFRETVDCHSRQFVLCH